MRVKRGSLVINLIQTPNGFSIVQGTQLLNKSEISIQKQAQAAHTSSILTAMNTTSHVSSQLKDVKTSYQKINLLFPRKARQHVVNNAKSQLTKQKRPQQQISKYFPSDPSRQPSWFSISHLHQNQITQLKLWYLQQNPHQTFSSIQSQEFKQYLLTYQKHRNIIVQLYYKDYYKLGKYLPASQVRKRIPYDSYWLMKIHNYLENHFVINNQNNHFHNDFGANQYIYKYNHHTNQLQMIDFEFQLAKNDQLQTKTKDQQNYQTLKFITAKLRPHCDYCGIHCGVVWFYHFKQTDPKEVSIIMKNVNSKNPPLSQKPYEMTLCTRCYCDGNFPLLLTHHDFKKTTINDKLQPNKKTKLKKKKKQKKRRHKQNQISRERIQKEEDDQIFLDNQQKQELENQQNNLNHTKLQNNKNQQELQNKLQFINKAQEICPVENPQVVTEPRTIKSIMDDLINSLQKPKKWTLQQTLRLLQLVEQHGQNWSIIQAKLQRQGICDNISIEQILNYFVSLPKRRISKLKQEYEPQQFLLQNYKTNRNSVSDIIAQRTLNRCLRLAPLIKQKQTPIQQNKWMQNLNRLIGLQQQRLMNRIKSLQEKQNLAISVMRKLSKLKP